jgi:hypothetical protein
MLELPLQTCYPLVYENKWLRLELSQLSIGANSRQDQFAMQRESINASSSLNKGKDYAKMDETIIENRFKP